MLEELLQRICANDTTLMQINLQLNEIDTAGVTALAEALKFNQTLTQINLGNNHNIDSVGAIALAEVLKVNQTLTQINLGNNYNIDTVGAIALAEALKVNQTLMQIDLGNNYNIDSVVAIALAEALTVNQTVTQINLRNSKIGNAGATAFAEALKVNQTLTQIDLGNNQIGAAGAIALAEALKINQTLTQIDLWGNRISNAGATALVKALKVNQTVTQFDFRTNSKISAANQQAIRMALQTNQDRIKTTRNQTLLTLLILLRHTHSSQQNLPLDIWELMFNLFDFPSVNKGYQTSCAIATFLKQENVFTEFNQRLQSRENFQLVEIHNPKMGESRFSFLTPRTIRAQESVIPAENSEPLAKRPKYR